jgi:hypothetical protein
VANSAVAKEKVGTGALQEKLRIRTKIFFTLYALFNSAAMFVHIFTSSYFNYKITETLSAQTADGWCAPAVQGIGNHCFGDFYSVLRYVSLPRPWSTDPATAQPHPNPLPPFVSFLLKPFAHLAHSNPSSVLPLMLFLPILIFSALLPTLHAYFTKRASALVCLLMAAMTLNMAPLFVGLDRGNIIVVCIPLLYFFYIGIMDSRFRLAVITGLLLVLIKPQMILLGFIFLANHQWKLGIKWLFTTMAGYPHDVFRNISDFIQQVSHYQDFVHQGGLIPVNVSFSNTLGIFLSFISTYQFPAGLVPGISIIVCLLAGGGLLVFGNRRSIFHNLVIVTCLPILVPGVTFNYYLVLLIVPLLFLASDLAADGGISKDGISSERNLSFSSMPMFSNRWIGTLFTATYLLLLIPWAIPWSLVVTSIQGSPPPITGINWAIGQFCLVILFLLLLFSVESRKTNFVKSGSRKISRVIT